MKVLKFGGSSVASSESIHKVIGIVKDRAAKSNIAVVVSALGGITDLLLEAGNLACKGDENYKDRFKTIEEKHLQIARALIPINSQSSVLGQVKKMLNKLETTLEGVFLINELSNKTSDKIVSYGELLSSFIISEALKNNGLDVGLKNAQELIMTNNNFSNAAVKFDQTNSAIASFFKENKHKIVVLPGFVASTENGEATTLGRGGSDYTAAIFAYCCDAESVTIWKDVPGMLNADPKWFDNTIKLDKISFKEAIELSYYGASVIHPKTVKPLQNKNIPLYVKSFIDPKAEGTVIQASTDYDHLVPSFIFKMDQLLFSITTKDFSFIVEENLSDIFSRLSNANAKINLMQNSALSFSILLDHSKVEPEKILQLFNDTYAVKYNEGLELVTIRHYDQATIDRVTEGKEIILEQKTRQTIRIVMKNK